MIGLQTGEGGEEEEEGEGGQGRGGRGRGEGRAAPAFCLGRLGVLQPAVHSDQLPGLSLEQRAPPEGNAPSDLLARGLQETPGDQTEEGRGDVTTLSLPGTGTGREGAF